MFAYVVRRLVRPLCTGCGTGDRGERGRVHTPGVLDARTTWSQPSRRATVAAISALSIGALLAGCGSDPAGIGAPAAGTPPAAEDAAAPEVAAPQVDDWPAPGRNTRWKWLLIRV